jgi:hypothetical protein
VSFSIFDLKTIPMKFEKITSIQELIKACCTKSGNRAEFFIALGGGMLRSSKNITYDPEHRTFSVENEIDDTYQEDLTEDQLKSETNIVEAIESGAFYQYVWE